MHKLVLWVFKTVGIAVVAMLLFNLTIALVDIFNATAQIQSVGNLMQTEICRNNCLLEETENTFKTMLAQVSNESEACTGITVNWASYDEAHIGNYGDLKTVDIAATFSMTLFGTETMDMDAANTVQSALGTHVVTVNFSKTVPCLRYMK